MKPVTVELVDIPDDNVGYARGVLRAMQQMTLAGAKDPKVQTVAMNLVGASVAQTLKNDWDYLKRRIPYAPDPEDRERVTSARYTVGHGAPEDCDGMSVAAATLLYLQNIPCHFEVIEWRTNAYTHVITVVDLPGSEIPFDLTMDSLGEEHAPTKTLKYPIMAKLEMISDFPRLADTPPAPTVVQSLVDKVAYGTADEKTQALKALHMFFPQQITKTYQWGNQVRAFNTGASNAGTVPPPRSTNPADYLGVRINTKLSPQELARQKVLLLSGKGPKGTLPAKSGPVGDVGDAWQWLASAVSVVTDVVTGDWAAIPLVIANGLKSPSGSTPDKSPHGATRDTSNMTPEKRLVFYLEDTTGVPVGTLRDPQRFPQLFDMADPRRKDRSVTNYMTYLDELPQVYYSSYRPLGNMLTENNYSSVIVPVTYDNVPVFGALKELDPEMIFVSFDNETSLLSPFVGLSPEPVGTYGFTLSGLLANGTIVSFPGYYTRTTFMQPGGTSPSGVRYDFVGNVPTDIPQTDNGSPQEDWTKSTAWSWLNKGVPPTSRITGTGDIALPTATPPHVTVTPLTGGTPSTGNPTQDDAIAAAAAAYFKAGGGDKGNADAMAAYLAAGGNVADALAQISKLSSMPFSVKGNTPALQNPGGGFSEYIPYIAAGAGALVLITALK